jgi:hypothetical protein
MNDYFLVKNFYNYEKVISPPSNLPKHLKTVYVTDNDDNEKEAIKLGWSIVKKTNQFDGITDKFERRKVVAYINSYPSKVVPEISDARFIFVCDSNIVRTWNLYSDFVNSCNENFVLFVTSGYYKGTRNTIMSECSSSLFVDRWSYNHDKIKSCTSRYVEELTKKNVDISNLSVVSAKYLGWNINHPDYKFMSDILYKEYCENLQGNIILTYMSGMYKDKVYNYFTNNYEGSILNGHNYLA